jgi:lipopolysaccharide export system protein LptA
MNPSRTSYMLRRCAIAAALSLAVAHSTLLTPARAADAPPAPTELRGDYLEMTSTDDETLTVVTGNVILTGTNLRITCDRLRVEATRLGDKDATIGTMEKFKYILATGNVHITQGDREATCQRAEVFPREDMVVLTEDPVVIDKSNGFNGAGEKITLFRGNREIRVDKPRFTGPPVGDMSATATPRKADPTTPTPKPTAK